MAAAFAVVPMVVPVMRVMALIASVKTLRLVSALAMAVACVCMWLRMLSHASCNPGAGSATNTGANDGTCFPCDRLAHRGACSTAYCPTDHGSSLLSPRGSNGCACSPSQSATNDGSVFTAHALTEYRTCCGPSSATQQGCPVICVGMSG